MFDFNKSNLLGIPVDSLLNNTSLDFKFEVSEKTGEMFENSKVSQFNEIDKFCTIKNNKYTTLKFSFHKYYNKRNQNYNDFDINNFLEVLNDLSNKFSINPFLATIHNIEFGVNVSLPFKTEIFLNSIISFKGNEYKKETYKNKGYLLRFEFEHYELKIYDKGLQNELNENILRFEIKVRKMDYLKSKGISVNNYSDLLNENTIQKLTERLLMAFDELLTYDNSINIKTVKSQREREILLKGNNPKYWNEIKNPNTLKSKRKRFKDLILKHGSFDMQKTVFELINEKLKLITKIDTATNQKINSYLAKFKDKTTPEMTDFFTANQKPNYTQNDSSSIGSETVQLQRYCLTCGNNITNQKKGSLFCSELLYGKKAKKCRNQKSNPVNNYKRKELRLYFVTPLLFEVSEYKIANFEHSQWANLGKVRDSLIPIRH